MVEEFCKWIRAFDGHFNLSCANEYHERGNGNFRDKDKGSKWQFNHCPYCGRKIKQLKSKFDVIKAP